MRKTIKETWVAPLTLMSTGCMGAAPEIPYWQGAEITVFDCLEWTDSVDLYGVSYSEDCLEWAEQGFSLPYFSNAFGLAVGVQFFLDFSSVYAVLTQVYTYRVLGEDPIGYSYSNFYHYSTTDHGYELKLGDEEMALSCHHEASLLHCQGLEYNIYSANFSFETASEAFSIQNALRMFN